MSPHFENLEKQARRLTPQEEATLAHILIEDLDPAADSQVEELWIAESETQVSGVRLLPGRPDKVLA
jgi:hypothetical protein